MPIVPGIQRRFQNGLELIMSQNASHASTSHASTSYPVVDLRGVTRTYTASPPVRALQECHLSVSTGDFATIAGPSGSGKSTLLHIIGLLDRPTSGDYLLDGVSVQDFSENERTSIRGQKIGFVFQAFQLLEHRTSLENVMLSQLYRGTSSAERRDISREALEQVGLASRANSLPSRMSGGERQRVAIARALAGRPSLLLCDEPTGNLDSASSDSILRLFDELNRTGITIVMITHDLSIAELGNRHISIRDGVMTEASPS